MTTYVNPGLDASGNGNNWTTNNINWTSSGSTFDTMTDVPTNTSATASNFCTINPLIPNLQTITDANLKVAYATGAGSALGTIAMTTGKYYWEVTALTSSIGQAGIGVFNSLANTTSWLGAGTNSWAYWNGGQKYTNASGVSYGTTWGAGDVIGVAVDADAGSITFYKNNVSQGVAYSGLTGPFYPAHCAFSSGESMAVNFGQQPFTYTPPSGYVALNTYNLPTPTIGATASSQANKYFDATLYSGSASTPIVVTNAGSFQPDFLWVKRIDQAEGSSLQNAVGGSQKHLTSNIADAEYTETGGAGIVSFNSNGFSVGTQNVGPGGVNAGAGSSYVGWQWKANGSGSSNTNGSVTSTVSVNTTSGFSVVTYTGPGSGGGTVGHGLGVAPSMIIVKNRSAAESWRVGHAYMNSGSSPWNYYMNLNANAAQSASSAIWNNTAPTSTVFSIANDSSVSGSGNLLVAYCFAEVAGFSKFGYYTGNSSTDGPFIYTGFRPRYIIIKKTNNINNWTIFDTARNPYNESKAYLNADNADAEYSGNDRNIDILSNGFKPRYSSSATNETGSTYIYMAFAESPFKYANAR